MAKPEKVFRAGAVRASIFRNVIHKQGKTIPLPKVVLEVRYKDKEGNWQGTNSLSLNEIPKAMSALRNAYDYLLEHREEPKPGDEFESDKDKSPGMSVPEERVA